MEKLDTPDLCARLDTLRRLCDRLEALQHEPAKYLELVRRIHAEATQFRAIVTPPPPGRASARKRKS